MVLAEAQMCMRNAQEQMSLVVCQALLLCLYELFEAKFWWNGFTMKRQKYLCFKDELKSYGFGMTLV